MGKAYDYRECDRCTHGQARSRSRFCAPCLKRIDTHIMRLEAGGEREVGDDEEVALELGLSVNALQQRRSRAKRRIAAKASP